MSESIEKWDKEVQRAQEHAERVFKDEVARLEKQIEHTDKHEDRVIKHVEDQVVTDAAFAFHHVEYLRKVIGREEERVARANDRLAKKQANGASEAEIQRAAEHAVRVEDDAVKHVEKVAARVLEHIERDAVSAARHIVKGLDKLNLDEEALEHDVEADAERVAKAIDNLINKANS